MASLFQIYGGPAGFGPEPFLYDRDDGSVKFDASSAFPHGLNFFGTPLDTSQLYVNVNGNVTFNSALSAFTPFNLTGHTGDPIFAPFFADVDVRGAGIDNGLYFHLDVPNSSAIITWHDVGYYNQNVDLSNAFQMLLIGRSGPGFAPGDFDIEFRYEAINWTTGDASGGTDGLAYSAFSSTPALVGYAVGDGVNSFEASQSGDETGLLNLPFFSNVGEPGVLRFEVRNGVSEVPVPATLVLLLAAAAALVLFARRARTMRGPAC